MSKFNYFTDGTGIPLGFGDTTLADDERKRKGQIEVQETPVAEFSVEESIFGLSVLSDEAMQLLYFNRNSEKFECRTRQNQRTNPRGN